GRLERFELKTNRREEDRSDLRRVTEILENPGEDAAARLAKEIDLDQFITHWALESLIGFWDGYASNQNNYYLYKSPKDSRFHFIPWGADMTMSPPFFPAAGGKSVFAKGQLAFQLNQDPAIRQQYHKTLLKLLDTVWHEEQMIAEVDRIQELVKGQLHPAQNGTEQAAEATRKFLRERRAEILAEIKDGPIHVTKAPAQPFYFRESGKVSATFATEWSPKDAKKPVESNNATLELELNGEPVKFTAVTTTSGPARFAGFGGPPGPLPPTVVLIGVRESDKKKLTLTVNFTPDQFQSAPEDSLVVQGAMVEGEGAIFGPGVKTFQGKVRLKSAGREDGSKVEGSLSGKLYEMRGGFGG
ncbi:MAG: CotH kinase family protein, partial [Planctomycetota bacterium]|nr:CotH kinase family protein [Planctomycetota bacterium]